MWTPMLYMPPMGIALTISIGRQPHQEKSSTLMTSLVKCTIDWGRGGLLESNSSMEMPMSFIENGKGNGNLS